MTAIERTKWMDNREVQQLRTVTQAWAITDKAAGRVQGILTWAVVDAAMLTGLRVSELSRLNVGDVDVKRGLLQVTRSKRRDAKPEALAIPHELVQHLRDFIEWKSDAEQDTSPDAPLFVGKRGNRLTVSGLQRVWKRAIHKAGLPDEYSIHSARHTVAVALLRRTANLRHVQKQLGHSDPSTTANMYADVSFEDMQNGMSGVYNNGHNGTDAASQASHDSAVEQAH